MKVKHHRDPVFAVTDHNGPGLAKIEWEGADDIEDYAAEHPGEGWDSAKPGPSGFTCDGWIEGAGDDAILYAPLDGDSAHGEYLDVEGRPSDKAGRPWYVVGTGEPAVHGVGIGGFWLAPLGLAGFADPAAGRQD